MRLIDADTIFEGKLLIIRDAAYDAVNAIMEKINNAPTVDAEPTEEQVKEYCRKRCLVIVDSELFNEMITRWSAEPVRRGHWEWDEDGIDWNIGAWKCSECRSTAEAWWAGTKNVNPNHCSGHRYCSNCGVIMDEAIDTPTDPVAK